MKTILICFFFLALASCKEKDEMPGSDCIGKKTNIACYSVYMPVCGCNGRTYGNACEAGADGVKKYTADVCQ